MKVTKISPITLTFQEVNLTCPLENGHRMMPVKTICQIIDVDFQTQDNWLKKHEFFGQLYRLAYTTGADGKQYEMRCLSIFDVGYWLGSISFSNRRPGSIEKQNAFLAWLREKTLQLYKSIEAFMQENARELELIQRKSDLIDELSELKNQEKKVKEEIKKVDHSIEDVREKRYIGQPPLPFPHNEN